MKKWLSFIFLLVFFVSASAGENNSGSTPSGKIEQGTAVLPAETIPKPEMETLAISVSASSAGIHFHTLPSFLRHSWTHSFPGLWVHNPPAPARICIYPCKQYLIHNYPSHNFW